MSTPTRHLIDTATAKALRLFAVLFFLAALFPGSSALESFLMLSIAGGFVLAGLILLALALIVDATVTTAHASMRAADQGATPRPSPAATPITAEQLAAAEAALKRAQQA